MDEEIEVGVVSREHVSIWVMKDMFIDVIHEQCGGLFDSVFNYLLSYEYVNFGVELDFKKRISAKPSKGRVIFIGVGLAGLAAARQLMLFELDVIVLEG
ncbi:hypothetical protein H5410_051510 [Solanum commersonii]|uniref:Uncharacterized protein n=1 Tax=Solanum commersonii TaxID=4109 RepID=A0A9J5WYL7_SOLCO|nr:hypothetical protein H5410_051510 [Solanum commersonii]